MTTTPDSRIDLDDVEQALARAVASELALGPGETVDLDVTFADLGLDSVGGISVANQVGGELDIQIPPVLLFDFPSIRTLAQQLDRLRRASA